jgi:hypothetical protein
MGVVGAPRAYRPARPATTDRTWWIRAVVQNVLHSVVADVLAVQRLLAERRCGGGGERPGVPAATLALVVIVAVPSLLQLRLPIRTLTG